MDRKSQSPAKRTIDIPELRLQMAELERDKIEAKITAEWNELLKRRYRGPILSVELSPYQVVLTEEMLHGIIFPTR